MNRNVSEAQEIELDIDEKRIPELIQGQIGKLNELDAGVKEALDAAGKAEAHANAARDLSAGRGLFKDKKKEAIEGLQEAGVELAGAVQLGTRAHKLSFELQKRLAEVTKYLFTLGVKNITANRVVVRELEMRLRGASEEELSELARQEMMSVIRQLKEQEDLLRKQEQMRATLSGHDFKISHLLAQTEDLELRLKDQGVQQRTLSSMVDSMDQVSKLQQQEISTLRQQVSVQQVGLERLATALAQAESHAEQATASLRSTLNLRTALLVIWAIAVPAAVHFL